MTNSDLDTILEDILENKTDFEEFKSLIPQIRDLLGTMNHTLDFLVQELTYLNERL